MIGEFSAEVSKECTAVSPDDSLAPCGCLKRQMPPAMPNSLPFPAVEANRLKLQQYLLDYYKPLMPVLISLYL